MLHQRQLPLLRRHQAFLLRQFQCRRRARVKTGLHQPQHILRVGQIQFGNAALFLQRQCLCVAAGHTTQQRQLYRGLIELAGAQGKLRTVAGGALATPEVDFVAGCEVGVKVVHSLIAAVGIQLAVTVSAQ
ncbi:hypothetical protein D3C87_1639380 [compost metagenome]